MLKRLPLVVMLLSACVSPAFAYITAESQCVADTFDGVYSGDVDIEAVWSARSFSCDSGQYLSATVGGCVACIAGSYCTGVQDVVFDDTNHGIESCPGGFTSDAATAAQNQCWKIDNVSCAEYNPYSFGHGSAVYANNSADCKTYYGASSCQTTTAGACDIVSLNCDAHYSQETVGGQLKCVQSEVVCPIGTYLPGNGDSCVACLADNYCGGGTYTLGASTDTGLVACASGLFSPVGARSEDDCGRLLHIGDDILHLHKDKRTEHYLVIKVDGVEYYADATPVSAGEKTINPNTSKTLRVKIDDIEYFVHETIYE